MELILFGNSISILYLSMMIFLYIFTISIALCGTISVSDVKDIISVSFLRELFFGKGKEEKEGFSSIFKDFPNLNRNKKQCMGNNFIQNKFINNNTNHPLNNINAYELDPAAYEPLN
tara:strand:+ start:110 stop:460 length:351 start_codon:yes stop_codon:yes gene_type:complete